MKKFENIIKFIYLPLFLMTVVSTGCQKQEVNSKPPNVILVITDDQGYGDMGYHGNPNVKTPTLDAFARESIRFNDFHVSPVCLPQGLVFNRPGRWPRPFCRKANLL